MKNDKIKMQKIHLREKYLHEGLDGLTEEEKIQLLLSYSESGDYIKTAHQLTESFSTLSALLDADLHVLSELNEKTAVLIKLIPQLSRAYFMGNNKINVLNSSVYAKKYFENYFIGASEEQLVVVCTDEKFKITASRIIASGSAIKISSSCRVISDFALNKKSFYIFIAHNHPLGSAFPSATDYSTTEQIKNTLCKYGITLVDHIIVGKQSSVSMAELPYSLSFRSNPSCGYIVTHEDI